MILFPSAKINLGLNVLRKRDDGFHEIESVMLAIPFYDVLEVLEYHEFQFHQTGLTISGTLSENLCVRAYEILKKDHDLPPVYMHLRKEIPMGAGLGGGSADAAFVLKGINLLFDLGLKDSALECYAAQLGSDCPFFVHGDAQIAKGRGEQLQPIDLNLKGYYLKIVNPGIHVGTKEAYAGIVFRSSHEPIEHTISLSPDKWKDTLINDFEASVFALHPALQIIKDRLYGEGAVYAAMSGSGSTMYALYSEKPELTFEDHGYLEKVLSL